MISCNILPRRMMMTDLEARIAALPCWRGKGTLERLRGGLSNASFLVDDGGGRFVARYSERRGPLK
jgi:hypothetical protein